MDSTTDQLKELLEDSISLGANSIELYKLKIIQRISVTVPKLIVNLMVYVALFVAFVMFTIGMALWVGKITGNQSLGFYTIAIIYTIIAIVFSLFLYNWIKRPVADSIIKEIFK